MRLTVLTGDLVHHHGKWIKKSIKTLEKYNNYNNNNDDDNNNNNNNIIIIINNNNKVKGLDFLST